MHLLREDMRAKGLQALCQLYDRLPCPLLLLPCADKAMQEVFDADYVSLHVRVTNKVAFHMYHNSLVYE